MQQGLPPVVVIVEDQTCPGPSPLARLGGPRGEPHQGATAGANTSTRPSNQIHPTSRMVTVGHTTQTLFPEGRQEPWTTQIGQGPALR
eukprot:2474006-Karenia_brevis.AAC.1